MSTLFENRADAGKRLAKKLAGMGLAKPVVLALPRGGVPVAVEVAKALDAPLDLLLVRKIGAPMQPELAIGAVGDGDEPTLYIDEETLIASGATREQVIREVPRQWQEIGRRRQVYLQGRLPLKLLGRTAVLVDDGIATGSTVRAALQVLRRRQPEQIVLAVPVAPAAELPHLCGLVDKLVCIEAPERFGSVGAFYMDFAQVEDDEVVALLGAQRHREVTSGGRTQL